MIGVQVQNVTPELAKSFGMTEAQGARVGEVNPDSPAPKPASSGRYHHRIQRHPHP